MCLNDYNNFLEKDKIFVFLSLHKNSVYSSAFVFYLFHLNQNVRLKYFKLFGTSAKLFSTLLIFSVILHDKKKDVRFLHSLMSIVFFFILIILHDHNLLIGFNTIVRFFFIVKMTEQLTETATAHSFSKLLDLSFYMHTCIMLTIHHYWLQFLTCRLKSTVITHCYASL